MSDALTAAIALLPETPAATTPASEHPRVRDAAERETRGCDTDVDRAVKLFYFVRDQFKYTIFVPRFRPEDFRASLTLERTTGFCIPKSVLLVALCRAVGIPARLIFAVIRNHRWPDSLKAVLKGNEIPDHCFAELHVADRWVRVTPSFDLATCQKHRFKPVEFDGRSNATLHPEDQDGHPHIEYVTIRGTFADLPFDEIQAWLAPALTPEARELLLGK